MTGSPSVVPIFPGDFPEVLPLLRRLDPHRTPEAWRPIFEYRWRRPEEPVGYALREGERLLGYLGTILSTVTIDGHSERFCNVTSWIVLDEARGAGALLVLPLQRLRDTTITSLTSNAGARGILLRLGFQELDSARTILRPSLRSAIRGVSGHARILSDPDEIRPLLQEPMQRILDDHLPYCHHLGVDEPGGFSYAAYTLHRRRGVRFARLHYLSDPERFAARWPRIQLRLLRRHRAVYGEVDSRLVSGIRIPGSVQRSVTAPRLYRSSRLRPDQVSNLYSELILLHL